MSVPDIAQRGRRPKAAYAVPVLGIAYGRRQIMYHPWISRITWPCFFSLRRLAIGLHTPSRSNSINIPYAQYRGPRWAILAIGLHTPSTGRSNGITIASAHLHLEGGNAPLDRPLGSAIRYVSTGHRVARYTMSVLDIA
eukprot:2541899-Rhodomonas_salina.1